MVVSIRICRLLAVVAALAAAGCSKGPDVFAVHGRVAYEGKPMDGALVIFRPSVSERTLVMARANANGEYTLATSGVQEGVSPGEYRVTITWEKFARPGTEENPNTPGTGVDRLNGKYADVNKTPLKATVEAKDNTINFELP
jgi:hypothetical protein